ncbi:MAG: hypothetical protein ILA17_12090 [Ruminococcus sp.]|nr:hypothetical protein [Ruminococcus sp.]
MKRIICVLFAAVMLVSCAKNSSSQTARQIGKAEIADDSKADSITVCELSDKQIKIELESRKNFKAADDLMINIPNNAPVIEFDTKKPYIPDWEQDFDTLYKSFKDTFAYLFPDRRFDEDRLYYHGKGSQEKWNDDGEKTVSLNKVKDDMQKLKGKEGGSVYLEYDEGYDKQDKSGCVMFTFGPDPEQSGIGMMTRRTAELDGCEVQDVYPPDSSEEFSLSGKQVSVRDAVSFFESYIDKEPCPKQRNCKIRVAQVEVLRYGGEYAYHMLCAKEIGGICTESLRTASSYSKTNDYGQDCIEGYMIKQDEIESFQGCTPNIIIENAKAYDSVIPFESAADRISSELTDEVTFEVRAAELVYCQKPIKKDGYIDINGYPMNVQPVWKLTLYNPNDMYTYFCYLTVDGKDFSYCAGKRTEE